MARYRIVLVAVAGLGLLAGVSGVVTPSQAQEKPGVSDTERELARLRGRVRELERRLTSLERLARREFTAYSDYVQGTSRRGPEASLAWEDLPLEPGERDVGVRRVNGVTYHSPVPLPQALVQRFQQLEQLRQLLESCEGQYLGTTQGIVYQLDWVDPESILYTRIGLRAADLLVSLNGRPIGASKGESEGLYERVKHEQRFALEIEREGARQVFSFHVK